MVEEQHQTIKCPNEECGKKMKWSPKLAGKKGPCPACKARIEIPQSPDQPVLLLAPPPVRQETGSGSPEPQPKVKPETEPAPVESAQATATILEPASSSAPDKEPRSIEPIEAAPPKPKPQPDSSAQPEPAAQSSETVSAAASEEISGDEDYYQLLGISQNASDEEIKNAVVEKHKQYRNRVNHPDLKKRQSAERVMETIQKAKEILLAPEKRRQYNERLADRKGRKDQPDQVDITDHDEMIARIYELIERGRSFEAIPLGKEAVERWPNDADSWAALAYAHAAWNQIEDAVYEMKKCIELDPSKDTVHYDLGIIFAENERYDEAMKCFERAAQINSAEPAYKLAKARLYFQFDRFEEAAGVIEPIYENEQNPVQKTNLAYDLALTYNDWGAYLQNEEHNLKGAFEYYRKASKIPFRDQDLREIVRQNLAHLRAAPGSRAKAFAADAMIVMVGASIIFGILGPLGTFGQVLGWIVTIPLISAYYILSTEIYGKTIGKALCSMRVIDEDGNNPSRRASAIRFAGFAATILLCFTWIGFLSFAPMYKEGKQTMYDKFAGTQVISE